MDPTTAAALRRIGAVISPDNARATAAVYAPQHPAQPADDVVVDRDSAYGPHPRNLLDTFRPAQSAADGERRRPVLVFVHGGNFVAGDKHTPGSPFYDNVGVWAARQGFVGITVTYRLAPGSQYPSALEDLSGVVDWIRTHADSLGADPDAVVLMGASAGAVHVATWLAAQEPDQAPVAGAVLLSGLYDLRGLPREPVLNTYYGPVEDLAEVSPLPRLAGTGVPLMVTVTELDPPGHHRQFLDLAQAVLARQGTLPRLLYLPGHNHFSEVLHLGTTDHALGRELRAFVESLGKDG
jgi:acetyl esterase/lipase